MDNSSEAFTARVGDLVVRVSKLNHLIERVTYQGTDVVIKPVVPIFSRAATNNDRGGTGVSFAGRWLSAGLERLTARCEHLHDLQVEEEGNAVVVSG